MRGIWLVSETFEKDVKLVVKRAIKDNGKCLPMLRRSQTLRLSDIHVVSRE